LLAIPALRERFVKFALRRNSELDINYRDSTLSEECDRFHSGPHAGDRAPDGHLVDSSGAATSVAA
jgi:hypothetical protein